MAFQLKRAYDPPARSDGYRVLIDRLWPRGVSKQGADLDEWARELSPSNGLRRWFGHDPAKFEEFGSRYRTELHEPERASALRRLQLMASHDRLTLLTATKHLELSQAAILAAVLCASDG